MYIGTGAGHNRGYEGGIGVREWGWDISDWFVVRSLHRVHFKPECAALAKGTCDAGMSTTFLDNPPHNGKAQPMSASLSG
jgi:hypothetical protein